jgi:DNA repair exonuclease SbcCD ATPase subunit
MDLFNPPLEFNYKQMSHNLEVEKLDNPYVQVVWEDTPDNFTSERIKNVKQYFQKKYLTTNVNVITRVKNVEDTMQSVDVSFNILDKNYQHELIKSYLTSKSLDKFYDDVLKIDSQVENKLIQNQTEVTPFKKWYIKKIEFSNFLSYGENQVLDFDKCNGITVIESNPPNFGGKTVLSVDLLMFLFFNTTTKTNKAEEIFNRFSDKNKVSVRGYIQIDGDDYIISRQIERKLAKSGEWNVKTELDFFKQLPDGSILNFTGEQRRETENFIKTSIGDIDDFLMTILTTATNLEDLIEAKPTARGQVLSRFMGLEFLKKKEETGKEIYSEFSKSMISNVYNSEQLKTEITTNEEQVTTFKNNIIEFEKNLEDVKDRLSKGEKYKEGLVEKKYKDIDNNIAILNPDKLNEEINSIDLSNRKTKSDMDMVKVIEPHSFYYEDEHDKIKEEYNSVYKKNVQVENKIQEINELKESVNGGIKCEHCGIELMNAAITQSKIAELDGFISQNNELKSLMSELSNKEKNYVELKKEFDEYEKNKLIKEKYEITIENNNLKINSLKDKLQKYNEIQSKIEENKSIESQIIKANIRLDELKQELSKVERDITNSNFQIKNLEDKNKKNSELITKIASEFERERIYKIYLDCYGKNGVSKIIMKTMMPLINSELQRLMQDSSYFKLEVRINDKNEVEFWMIDNGTGIEKLMSSGSGYERTIASLALRSVLSKICSLPKPNVVVFDEIFGKISNDNLEMVSEFFVKIKDYFEKIIVITHNPLVSQWADNIIKVNKIDNISKVSQ